MTNKEKVDVLNELINKYAESPNPHEHDMVFNVLKEIKNDIASKEEPASKDLEKASEEYAYTNWESDDYHDGASEGLEFDAIGHTQICFKAGANWQKEQLINKACEWLKALNDSHEIMSYTDSHTLETDELVQYFKNFMD